MTLISQVQSLQDELDKRERSLGEKENALKAYEGAIAVKKTELTEKEKGLEAREKEVKSKEFLLLDKNQLDVKRQELLNKEQESAIKITKMHKWSDALKVLESQNEAKKEELNKRAAVLTEKEVDYKERIRKEFMDEVAKKLAVE